MPDVAIITTTIRVPYVMRAYAKLPERPAIIVAGDTNTPTEAIEFITDIGARYLPPTEQERRWECSSAIGWQSVQRRNIAVLEALRVGADVIITVDDDNEPISDDFISTHAVILGSSVTTGTGTDCGWVNPLFTHEPTAWARGVPYINGDVNAWHDHELDSDWRVGVSQSFVLGDPDTDALHRLVAPVDVKTAPSDVVIAPCHWSPINSQATAWQRKFAPLIAVLPHLGRYDDIWGGYIAQRILRAHKRVVRYGAPFVKQARNPHNYVKDLSEEIYGLQHTIAFTELLDGIVLSHDDTILTQYDQITRALQRDDSKLVPNDTLAFMTRWLDDCQEVL